MGRPLDAKRSRKRPNKTPKPQEEAPELVEEHTADHQDPENSKELREDATDYLNCHTGRLINLYKLFDVAHVKR